MGYREEKKKKMAGEELVLRRAKLTPFSTMISVNMERRGGGRPEREGLRIARTGDSRGRANFPSNNFLTVNGGGGVRMQGPQGGKVVMQKKSKGVRDFPTEGRKA